jgi:hypothetical protein
VALQFCNTDVDTVCEACAIKHDLCIHCGADQELRKNRRKFAFDPPYKPPPFRVEAPKQIQMATPLLLPLRVANPKGEVS